MNYPAAVATVLILVLFVAGNLWGNALLRLGRLPQLLIFFSIVAAFMGLMLWERL